MGNKEDTIYIGSAVYVVVWLVLAAFFGFYARWRTREES